MNIRNAPRVTIHWKHRQAVALRDADAMQAVENRVIGQAQRSGAAAAAMQSATHGVVGSGSVGGQQNSQPVSVALAPMSTFVKGNITIGEALEATALTCGQSSVDYSEAAAIQAAKVRATGRTNVVPGGVAAAAHQPPFAKLGRQGMRRRPNWDAPAKLPSDKLVMRRDAEGVIGAEVRNDPNLATHPGGVAASVAAAAMLNQSK
ncbi:seed maturation protein [Actinidia rufa]|uniref:Seed maturation protein n=1 Tax=Actinidia rufa TaxID=165716 RepID=A0A7J0FVW2_9ERIC|nr:seed maturation protein [Actinidia rufa]